jgi:hypothetical protein
MLIVIPLPYWPRPSNLLLLSFRLVRYYLQVMMDPLGPQKVCVYRCNGAIRWPFSSTYMLLSSVLFDFPHYCDILLN